jgi:hypothetical protein
VKTEVHFRSSVFNTTERKEYFINDGCFGDDVCRWLIHKLKAQRVAVDDEPGQEDFGWYFNFEVDGVKHCFVVGFRPDDPPGSGEWVGWVERDAGFLASLVGGRRRGISDAAVHAVEQVLKSAPEIADVTWHQVSW